MAAPASYLYANAKKYYADGAATTKIDWAGGTIKAVLVASAYTPDYDNHAFFSSVTNTVGTAASLTTKTETKIGTGATAKYALKSDVASFTGSLTARGLVIYQDTGTASTSPLICYVLLDSAPADVTTTVGINVTPDATNGWVLVG